MTAKYKNNAADGGGERKQRKFSKTPLLISTFMTASAAMAAAWNAFDYYSNDSAAILAGANAARKAPNINNILSSQQ